MIGLMKGLWWQASMKAYGYVMRMPDDNDRICGCIACQNFQHLVSECPLTMLQVQHSGDAG